MNFKIRAKEISDECEIYWAGVYGDMTKAGLLVFIEKVLRKVYNDGLRDAAVKAESWCDKAFHGDHCGGSCAASDIRSLLKGPDDVK